MGVFIAFLLITNAFTIFALATRSDGPATSRGSGSANVGGLPVIIDYGPKEYTPSKGFNVQPNGESAVWVRVSYGGSVTDLSLSVDGEKAGTARDPATNVLTALVPASVLAAGNPIELKVLSKLGTSSNVVQIKSLTDS